MARSSVRALNRVVARATTDHPGAAGDDSAGAAALELLERSVRFGHVRLALRRLALAVQLEADVPPAHWRYCRDVVSVNPDARLRELFLQVAMRWQPRGSGAAPIVPGPKADPRRHRGCDRLNRLDPDPIRGGP